MGWNIYLFIMQAIHMSERLSYASRRPSRMSEVARQEPVPLVCLSLVRVLPLYNHCGCFAGVSPSQTLQNSQTPLEGDTNPPVHKKGKKQHRRSPYLYLTSLLRGRRSDEDRTGILAGTDCEGPNYGTLP